jgi:hypothetical protein
VSEPRESVADRETASQTTEKTGDRGKRAVATATCTWKTGKVGQAATRETAEEIGHRSERAVAAITTRQRQTTATETTEEAGHGSKQAPRTIATAGQTRQTASDIAERAIITACEEAGDEARLAEQHAGYVLTEKVFTKTTLTGNAKTGELIGNHAEGEIVRQPGDDRVKSARHRRECIGELLRKRACKSAVTTATQHASRTKERIGELRQPELFRDTIFAGDAECCDRGDATTATTGAAAATSDNGIIGGAGRCEEHCSCGRYQFCCLHGHEPILPSRR